MTRIVVSGHFIEAAKGRIFLLLRTPPSPRACVLVAPPFGEEMNKCRRMTTVVAAELAQRGVATVVPDLYGSGDSEGNFADGDWATWQSDIAQAALWCRERGHAVRGVLAMRLGCALAAAAVSSEKLHPVDRTVLWQPVFDGGRFLNQLLRLRLAALLAEQDRKETMAELRARLKRAEAVEVAGYELSGRLAADLEVLGRPSSLPSGLGEVHWMEVVREAGLQPPQMSSELIEHTRDAGGNVVLRTFAGEPFWAATEIIENGELMQATVEALSVGWT